MAEGEPADCLMYLLDGNVRILADNTQISSIDIGGCFGESMFSEQANPSPIHAAQAKASMATFLFFRMIRNGEKNKSLHNSSLNPIPQIQ